MTQAFNHCKVSMAVQGKLPVEQLTPEEQEVHARILWQSLEDLDGSDDSLLQEIQKNGGTIYGIDKQGTIREADSS